MSIYVLEKYDGNAETVEYLKLIKKDGNKYILQELAKIYTFISEGGDITISKPDMKFEQYSEAFELTEQDFKKLAKYEYGKEYCTHSYY